MLWHPPSNRGHFQPQWPSNVRQETILPFEYDPLPQGLHLETQLIENYFVGKKDLEIKRGREDVQHFLTSPKKRVALKSVVDVYN